LEKKLGRKKPIFPYVRLAEIVVTVAQEPKFASKLFFEFLNLKKNIIKKIRFRQAVRVPDYSLWPGFLVTGQAQNSLACHWEWPSHGLIFLLMVRDRRKI